MKPKLAEATHQARRQHVLDGDALRRLPMKSLRAVLQREAALMAEDEDADPVGDGHSDANFAEQLSPPPALSVPPFKPPAPTDPSTPTPGTKP